MSIPVNRNRDLGLSIAHIQPRVPLHPELQVARGGNLVRLRMMNGAGTQVGGGKRGKIRGFSRQSRARLQQKLASVNRALFPPGRLPLFVTLTYPALWPDDPAIWKSHLAAFCKRLWRRFGECAIVWRLELQKRGAPHFHLLVFAPAAVASWFIPHAWVARAWYECVGSDDPAHLQAGTQVQRVKSWRGVAYYAGKYMAKLADAETEPELGRIWGIYQRHILDICLVDYCLSGDQLYRVRRALWRILRGRGIRQHRRGAYAGCSVYMSERAGLACLRL